MNLGLLQVVEDPEEALPLLERAQTLRLAHSNSPQAGERPFIRDLGMGYYNVALAQLHLGDASAAERNLRKAISEFEKLAKMEPNDLVNRHQAANCRRMIADVKAAGNESDAAIELYEQARDELRDLSLRNPNVPEFVADLAGVEMNLGAQLQLQGQLEAALIELTVAGDQLRGLVDKGAAAPRHLRDLGVALRASGQLLVELDRREDARERLTESKTVLEKLVREHPDEEQYATDLQLTIEALDELDAV
jgi:tetratricopeptide (TPR) repeat protein